MLPVSNADAEREIYLWARERGAIGAPRGLPKMSAHVPVSRGRTEEWSGTDTELVGLVVQSLGDDQQAMVKAYYCAKSDGSRVSVRRISHEMGVHHSKVNQALDCCVARVSTALQLKTAFLIINNA